MNVSCSSILDSLENNTITCKITVSKTALVEQDSNFSVVFSEENLTFSKNDRYSSDKSGYHMRWKLPNQSQMFTFGRTVVTNFEVIVFKITTKLAKSLKKSFRA